MSNRGFGSRLTLAAVVAVVSLAPAPVAGQARGTAAGCLLEEPVKFHRCALEKAKGFNPPRTPDGQPDTQGIWTDEFGVVRTGTVFAAYSVEGKVQERCERDVKRMLHER